MKKKRIGISSCFFHADPQRAIFKGKTLLYIEQSLIHWITREGVLAYAIPTPPDNGSLKLKDWVDDLDGLVLHGGSDVSPKSYGEEALKPEWQGDYLRDQYEIALFHEFKNAGKPILGICRGAQLVNVACGGTLIQDIPTQAPSPLSHRNWDIYDQNFHCVALTSGSAMADLYPNVKTARVNSIHHQGIQKLGQDLVIEARADNDGMIEAIRGTGNSFICAVQWHPEFQDPRDSTLLDGRPLLKQFLESVRK